MLTRYKREESVNDANVARKVNQIILVRNETRYGLDNATVVASNDIGKLVEDPIV